MAPPTLRLLPVLLAWLSLSLIAASQSAESGDSAPRLWLSHLLAGRSLQAPPRPYRRLLPAPAKRDDGYWIWMPAHGYMSVPRDEVAASSGDKDSMGNLLRYGRK